MVPTGNLAKLCEKKVKNVEFGVELKKNSLKNRTQTSPKWENSFLSEKLWLWKLLRKTQKLCREGISSWMVAVPHCRWSLSLNTSPNVFSHLLDSSENHLARVVNGNTKNCGVSLMIDSNWLTTGYNDWLKTVTTIRSNQLDSDRLFV